PSAQTTSVARVEPGGVDLAKLAALDRIADLVAAATISVEEGIARVRAVVDRGERYAWPARILAGAVMPACIARIFGGGLSEVAVAGVIGLCIGLLGLVSRRSVASGRVFEMLAA